MVIERLRSLFGEDKNHKADSIYQEIAIVFYSLPESSQKFKDGPSWIRIDVEDVVPLSRTDTGYLLAVEKKDPNLCLLAHSVGTESWIGLSTKRRRVRYSLEKEKLFVHYDALEENVWKIKYSKEIEDLDTINPIIAIAKAYIQSGTGPGSS